jgi:hypothetical protein
MFSKIIRYNNISFEARAPSKNGHSKYDIYHNNKYIVSFGDKNYQQYKDKIGYYKDKDHNNSKRRALYRKRHGNEAGHNEKDPTTASFWSWYYLW